MCTNTFPYIVMQKKKFGTRNVFDLQVCYKAGKFLVHSSIGLSGNAADSKSSFHAFHICSCASGFLSHRKGYHIFFCFSSKWWAICLPLGQNASVLLFFLIPSWCASYCVMYFLPPTVPYDVMSSWRSSCPNQYAPTLPLWFQACISEHEASSVSCWNSRKVDIFKILFGSCWILHCVNEVCWLSRYPDNRRSRRHITSLLCVCARAHAPFCFKITV
jgi:hypothetical protein